MGTWTAITTEYEYEEIIQDMESEFEADTRISYDDGISLEIGGEWYDESLNYIQEYLPDNAKASVIISNNTRGDGKGYVATGEGEKINETYQDEGQTGYVVRRILMTNCNGFTPNVAHKDPSE